MDVAVELQITYYTYYDSVRWSVLFMHKGEAIVVCTHGP